MSDVSYHAQLSASKRHAILIAACKGFVAQGFEKTTVEAVAREADVSTRTLFKHFPSKQVLFEASIQALGAAVLPAASPAATQKKPLSARAQVAGMVDMYLSIVLDPNALALSRLLVAELPHHPQLATHIDNGALGAVQAQFAALLTPLAQSKALKITDVNRAAHDIICLVSGYVAYPAMFGLSGSEKTLPRGKLIAHMTAMFMGVYGVE
jgi:TetR/AcrR family transcriptional regulator, regulator of autoinduction and epiphytic fitness